MPVKEYQKLKWQIKVWDIDLSVIVTLTVDGIDFKIKGTSKGVTQNWPQVIAICHTPDNVERSLSGQPMKYLQHVSDKITKNKLNNAAKLKANKVAVQTREKEAALSTKSLLRAIAQKIRDNELAPVQRPTSEVDKVKP